MFRKKDKEDKDASAQSKEDLARSEQDAELAGLPPGVRYVRRRLMAEHSAREEIVVEHLMAIHEPGGLAARKQSADFMELGTPHAYLDALSDLEFTIDGLVITTQQQVAARWTVTGVHVADLHGVQATGQPITIRGVTILVMQDKYVLSDYTYFDFPELTRRASEAATRPAPGA
jgi:predicted ester cyclase